LTPMNDPFSFRPSGTDFGDSGKLILQYIAASNFSARRSGKLAVVVPVFKVPSRHLTCWGWPEVVSARITRVSGGGPGNGPQAQQAGYFCTRRSGVEIRPRNTLRGARPERIRPPKSHE
jgi:hypothetical protein